MIELHIDPRGELAIENMGELLEQYPKVAEKAMAIAMMSAGKLLRESMKSAVEHGGPSGSKWPELNPHTAIISRANQRIRGTYQGFHRPVKLQNWTSRWIGNPKTGKNELKKIYWHNQRYTEKDPMTGEERERWGHVATRKRGEDREKSGKLALRQRGGGRGRDANRRQVDVYARKNPLSKLRGGIKYYYDEDDALLSVGFVKRMEGFTNSFQRIVAMQAAGYTTVVSRKIQMKMFALGFPISTKQLMTPARPLVRPVFEENKAQMIERVSQRFMMAITKHFAGEK